MSDVMLCGVLRMPPELWRNDDLQFMQVQSRMLEAADELEKRAIEIERLQAENAILLRADNDALRAMGNAEADEVERLLAALRKAVNAPRGR